MGLVLKLPLSALRAEKHNLGRLVIRQVRAPAALIGWQPEPAALGTARGIGDLGKHAWGV
jgi:hypothetical protein